MTTQLENLYALYKLLKSALNFQAFHFYSELDLGQG